MFDVRDGRSSAGIRVARRRGGGCTAPRTHGLRWRAGQVREPARPYEDEGSVREARGAVAVAPGVWWSVALAVPVAGSEGAPAIALLRLDRHGPSPALSPGARIDLAIPAAELDALVTLLAGVVAQARRDGVTP